MLAGSSLETSLTSQAEVVTAPGGGDLGFRHGLEKTRRKQGFFFIQYRYYYYPPYKEKKSNISMTTLFQGHIFFSSFEEIPC